VNDSLSDASIQDWVGSALAGLASVRDVRVILAANDEIDGVLVKVDSLAAGDEVRARLVANGRGDGPVISPDQIFFSLPEGHLQHTPAATRVEVRGVDLLLSGARARVRVRLAYGQRYGVGIESGLANPKRLLRLACLATLASLRDLGAAMDAAVFDSVRLLEPNETLLERPVVISAFSLVTCGHQQELIGTALVRRSDVDAAVRATLDAFNRCFVLG
jgi:hypothetical protein